MSYIAKRLAPGETVVFKARFHWMQYLLAWLALIFLGVFLIGVFIWAKELIRLSSEEAVVTNRRVVLKQGVFTIRVDEVTLNAIEGAHIDQSILGRIFNYGRITIRGSGDTHLLFPTLADPSGFRAAAEGVRITQDAGARSPGT